MRYGACSNAKLQFLRAMKDTASAYIAPRFLQRRPATKTVSTATTSSSSRPSLQRRLVKQLMPRRRSRHSSTFCDEWLVAPRHDVVLCAVRTLTLLRAVCRQCSRDVDRLTVVGIFVNNTVPSFLANVNSRLPFTFAICYRPSVCRL